MNKVLVLLSCLSLSACDLDLGSSYDPTTRTMYVDYYQEPCTDSATSLCFRTSLNSDDAYAVNTKGMSGFEALKWGSRYTVQVEAERDDNGKDTHYTLESIDSTKVIDASTNEFVLTFNMASGILQDNQNSEWIIAAKKTFTCTDADCTALTNAARDTNKIQLSFSTENDELTLLAVKCQSSDSNFSSVCEGVNDAVFDIAHYQTDCGLAVPRLCLVYKEEADASTDWNVLPFSITGFTAQWGLQYELDLTVKIQAKSLKSVEFIKENDAVKDRTNESFKMIMRTGVGGLEKSEGDVIRYDGLDFNCARFNQCNDIDDAVASADSSNEQFLILQALVESPGENAGDSPVIIIEDLLCDAGSNEFALDCVSDYDDVYWVEVK